MNDRGFKMYNLKSKEYVENGLYKIDGIEFYSIWTFKNKFDISNNSNSQNEIDAASISGNFYQSEPDFGPFRTIKIFSVNELNNYYFG